MSEEDVELHDEENKKPRKKKKQPLSPEEFEITVSEIVLDWSKYTEFFCGKVRKTLNLPKDAPSKSEFKSIDKKLLETVKDYEKIKAPKQKRVTTGDKSNKGFKQVRFAVAKVVTFVNANGDLSAELKLQPVPEAGGDAIFSVAQMTQILTWYINKHSCKNENKKSEITLTQPLIDLFEGLLERCDKADVTKLESGGYRITHNCLQKLTPKLFDVVVPVPNSLMTEPVKKAHAEREKLFKERTEAHNKKLADAKEAKKK
ncbi:MAG: hypothetical protein ACMG6E_03780, partial [Candidatus Roizmanbacteria bacterium]